MLRAQDRGYGNSLLCQRLPPQGTSVSKAISKRPVIFFSRCQAFGEKAINTYFNVLFVAAMVRAGLKLTTYRLQSERTTSELPRSVQYIF